MIADRTSPGPHPNKRDKKKKHLPEGWTSIGLALMIKENGIAIAFAIRNAVAWSSHENDGATFASELMDAKPNPETIYSQTEMGETLRRALAQLSPKQRTAIQLCELDGISIREAATALGVSKNTLKSRVARDRESHNLILGEAITTRRAIEAATSKNGTRTECASVVHPFIVEHLLPIRV